MMRPLEDQLRSLIDGGVSPVTADEAQRRATAWERAGPTRRGGARHRRIAVVVALTVALIAGAAFLVVGTGHDTSVRVESSGQPRSPTGEVVAVTSDGRLVVLASGDGHIVRVLANDAVAQGKDADGSTSLSVTPDGQTVYFMRQPAGCGGCASIASVPVAGGPITNPIGQGCCIREPAVSPDGHWLAFTGVPGKSDAGREILLRDLTVARPPQALVYDRLWDSRFTLDVGVGEFAWAPDSRHLAFVGRDTRGGTPPRVLDTKASQSILLDQLPPVLIKGADGMSGVGYLGHTGQMLAVSDIGDRPGQSLTAEHKPLRVVAIDPTTGNTTRVLFALAGASQPIADASGTHIVIQGADGLYRWSRGDRQPTKIADHVLAATWLPAAPSPPPSKSATIIAHLITPLRGGYQSQVVELGASNGQVRVLAQIPGGVTVYAIAADRRFVYADGFNEQPPGGIPCPGQAKSLTSVLRVPRSGGQPVLEATGTRPALSPNDTKLAYLHADCGTRTQTFVPGSLAVRELGTGTEHRWSLPPPYTNGNSFGFENIGPLQWAADGTHLLTRVVSGGQPAAPPLGPTNWWLVDTTAPSGRLHAAELPIPNSGPDAPLDIIALGSTGRWAALLPAAAQGGPLRVVDYNPTRGAVSTLLTTLQVPTNGTAHLVAADASGQHLLLIMHVAAPTTPGSPYIADTNELYQWNAGDAQPTKVASNIVAATW
jgi:hypothetical protein